VPPSVYQPSVRHLPIYPTAQGVTYCYWPHGKCLRLKDSANIKADVSSCPNQNDWGLSYDDGPTQGTSQLLAALGDSSVKATFFVIGSMAVGQENVLKEMDSAGHEMAAHTWTHHPLTAMSNEQIVAELKVLSIFLILVYRGYHFRNHWKNCEELPTSIW
jgi:peptidoglycan/xylan/chitin deacetylase (PgdA/CDA1 family)